MGKETNGKRDRVARRFFLKIFCLFSGTLVLGSFSNTLPSYAKDVFPAGRITFITQQSPGGGYDLMARAIGPYLTKHLREVSPGAKGGDVVIKNEPRVAGTKAYTLLYNAKPDGYTICTYDISYVAETLVSKLEFDLEKFTYLVRINSTSRILVTNKTGFANWEEMLKSAKTKELKWGIGAFGRATHVASIIIKEKLGIPARFVPFGGTAENMSGLLRGDVQISLVSEDSVKTLLDAGEIRILADFTGMGGYSGIPTLDSLGYPDLVEKVESHRYIIGPPGLPKEISNILIAALKKVFNDQGFVTWAKKTDFPLSPIYGDEADILAKRIYKFYLKDLNPILKSYLK